MKIACKGDYEITVQMSCEAIAIRQESDLVSVSDAEQAKALIAAIKDNAARLGWEGV